MLKEIIQNKVINIISILKRNTTLEFVPFESVELKCPYLRH